MKKILLSIFIVATMAIAANAQTEQGSILAGGNVSLDFDKGKSKVGSTSTDDGKTTTLTINPTVGYFVIDGLAVGLELNVTTSKTKNENDSEDSYSLFGVGPFVKYYHSSGLFGMGSFGVGSMKFKDTFGGTSNETKYGISTWEIGAGYAIFLNDNVSLEPMVSYGALSQKLKDSDPESKYIDSGLSFSVGFQIFLN